MEKEIVTKVAWAPIIDGKLVGARTRGLTLVYNIGGKPERKKNGKMETHVEAMIREAKEETTVDLIPESIKFEKFFIGPGVDKAAGKVTELHLYSADYIGTIQPAGEVEEIVYLGLADRHRVPDIGRQIIDWLYETGKITA